MLEMYQKSCWCLDFCFCNLETLKSNNWNNILGFTLINAQRKFFLQLLRVNYESDRVLGGWLAHYSYNIKVY